MRAPESEYSVVDGGVPAAVWRLQLINEEDNQQVKVRTERRTHLPGLHLLGSPSEGHVGIVVGGSVSFLLFDVRNQRRTATVLPLSHPVIIHRLQQVVILVQQQLCLRQRHELRTEPEPQEPAENRSRRRSRSRMLELNSNQHINYSSQTLTETYDQWCHSGVRRTRWIPGDVLQKLPNLQILSYLFGNHGN